MGQKEMEGMGQVEAGKRWRGHKNRRRRIMERGESKWKSESGQREEKI